MLIRSRWLWPAVLLLFLPLCVADPEAGTVDFPLDQGSGFTIGDVGYDAGANVVIMKVKNRNLKLMILRVRPGIVFSQTGVGGRGKQPVMSTGAVFAVPGSGGAGGGGGGDGEGGGADGDVVDGEFQTFRIPVICADASLPDPTPDAAMAHTPFTPPLEEKKKHLEALLKGLDAVNKEVAALAPSVKIKPDGKGQDIEYDGPPLTAAAGHLLRASDWTIDEQKKTRGELNRTVVLQFAFWALTDGYTEEDLRRRLHEPRFRSVQAREASLAWAVRRLLEQARFKKEIFDQYSAESSYNRGVSLLQAGKAEEAEVSLRAALEARPNYGVALYNLGLAQAAQNKPEEAQHSWEAARKLLPNDADIPYNLAALAWRQGRRDDAVRLFEDALRLKADHPQARQWLNRLREGR